MKIVRFALKPSKKQRRRDKKDTKKKQTSMCGAFNRSDEMQQIRSKGSRRKHRVELLEDVQAKVKRLKDEGNTLAEAGRFQAAMGRWKEAIRMDPYSAELYELLAQAAMAVYEDFQAVQFARKAVELAPAWSDGFLTLARCQLNFGEVTLALEALDQAVELNCGAETAEMTSDRQNIEELLRKQSQALSKRDEEAAREVDADKLQVISCLKHLTFRAKIIETELL